MVADCSRDDVHQVLPALGDTELPQALVLGTKVHNSAVPGWSSTFAAALRARVHASAGQPAGSAALDSVRLGLVMDKAGSLAAAVLANIDADWRGAQPPSAEEVRNSRRPQASTEAHAPPTGSIIWASSKQL